MQASVSYQPDGSLSLTELLAAWKSSASSTARNAAFRLAYTELRSIAHARLADAGGDRGLQATEIVHEAFLRMARRETIALESRQAFYFVMSRAMHDVLVEAARARGRKKRGGGVWRRVWLDVDDQADHKNVQVELLDVAEAVAALEKSDPLCASIARVRYICGLSIRETAEVLDLSTSSVQRNWTYAKAWLYRYLGGSDFCNVTEASCNSDRVPESA